MASARSDIGYESDKIMPSIQRRTLIRPRPILAYGSECWPLLKKDGNSLRIFKRRILRMFYDPINEDGICRRRCNNELCKLYYDLDIVKVITLGRQGLGHLFRMQ
jgi:hypothetical protein